MGRTALLCAMSQSVTDWKAQETYPAVKMDRGAQTLLK